ncbi:DNA polymerase I [Ketobacter sp.]|uniref:DNA polymerase I n=1 Tax=Ketobacter sp. TaxID=2083498 RepID=UPI0025BF71D2|nr:DNA polymerase I [Ketobacter sp.]
MNAISSNKPLVLVDGSSYLYRAFHALPPLVTSKGQPTGAIKGVLNMLIRLRKDYEPEYMAVIFDAKGKTFRDDLYPEYKAHRPPMPDDLRSQIEPLHSAIRAMGLPLLIIDGVEADDVIGTLCDIATQNGIDTIVSTGDKDMAQLVSDHVTLINTMNDSKMDRDGVIEKFGIPPERIIDYLTLVGDSVDNIPGVPKCGPKTAVKWLTEFGSLDNLMANADQIKGKIGENLRAALDQIPLSKQLATIKLDVALEQQPTDLKIQEPDNAQLLELYKDLEFKGWIAELTDAEGATDAHDSNTPITETQYQCITTQEAFAAWLEQLQQCDVFAFDTETTSLNYMQAELVGLSFSIEPGKAAYVPVAHDYPGAPDQLERAWVLQQLQPLLAAETPKKIGQNLKYDKSVLARYDIELNGIGFDTMLESYVLNSTASRHDMDSLALKYLGHKNIAFEDIAGKGAKQLTFNQIDLAQASDYAAEDADITLRLHQALWPQLEPETSLRQVFEDIEMPLLPVLSKIERTGALVNADMLRLHSQQLAKRMLELEKEAHDIAGEPFNLGSPKQLGEILFEKLGLPVLQKTPKGAPSTAEPVLQELALDYELPKVLMEYRGLSKLKSTYTDKLPELIDSNTGRIHTSYHQAVAATGRLSSSDPNLQNIPIRNDEGRKIRQAFIARPGCKLLAADYSQIELRIMAHLSGDQSLLDAFNQGLDIHKATAAEVMGVTLEDVTSDMRRNAKAVNFGLIYGMSAFGLAKQLGIGRKEAQDYIDTYFQRYPGVHDYMERIREQAAHQGYVETLFGRRLHLPEINSRNVPRRQAAERTAINAPMQGTAADIIKRAMIAVDGWLVKNQLETRMIMQVHDELVFEVPDQELDCITKEVTLLMEGAADLKVPLLVEVGVGDNWDQAH